MNKRRYKTPGPSPWLLLRMETYRFEFLSSSGHRSACQLQVCSRHALVVATYRGEGNSVTNECERIALTAVNRHGLNPDRLLFAEHYPDQLWEHYPETFKLITFDQEGDQFVNPSWTELDTRIMNDVLHLLANESL